MEVGIMISSLIVLLCLSATTAAPYPYDDQEAGNNKTCEHFADPKNGWVNHMMNEGSVHTAVFSCDDGYAIIGKNTIICIDGVWEKEALECKFVDCGAPESIENGRVVYTNTTYKSKAQYSCNPCYYLQGWEKRSCKQGGVWSKEPPTCVLKECGPPSLGPYLRPKRREPVKCASTIEVECTYGYRLKGASVATCLPGPAYFWHGEMPSCI